MFAGQCMGQRSALDLISSGAFGKRTRRKSHSILPIGALSKRTWRDKVAGGPHAFEFKESNPCKSAMISGLKLCDLKT
jgi:hypothetical protein